MFSVSAVQIPGAPRAILWPDNRRPNDIARSSGMPVGESPLHHLRAIRRGKLSAFEANQQLFSVNQKLHA
jgi:hypothetical protein